MMGKLIDMEEFKAMERKLYEDCLITALTTPIWIWPWPSPWPQSEDVVAEQE